MATFRVANFAELISANSGSSDGDEILFTTSTYTTTAAITFSKSLTFSLGIGVLSTTINVGHSFQINGQAGGTTQTWNGPFVVVSSIAKGITMGETLNGDLTVTLNNVEASAASGAGIRIEGDNTNTVNVTCNDCSSDSNANGFLCAGTGKATFVLNRCSATSNTAEGIRVSNGTISANRYVGSDSGNSEVYIDGSTNSTLSDCAFTGDGALALLRLDNTGTNGFNRCTATNGTAGALIGSTAGAPITNLAECNFTNNAATGLVALSGAFNITMFDSKLTQTGSLTATDVISTTGYLITRRCIIDASQSGGTPSYILTSGTGLRAEGNVLIAPDNTTGTMHLMTISDTTNTSNVEHNTFVKVGRGGIVHGIELGISVAVRGNVFYGLSTAIVDSGSFYSHSESGYNAFYSNTNDITGSPALGTDEEGLSYDPFLDVTNGDFRISSGSTAETLDPNGAFQIDYHQVSVAVRGQGLYSLLLSPALDDADTGPTDAGAYNNSAVLPTVTLTASPNDGWVFGRWEGETASTANPYAFVLTSSQIITVYFFSDITPHLTSPKGGEIFNLGKVDITWDTSNPLALNQNALLSYDIEYTDDYVGADATNWHSTKRRIPWNQSSYEWIVGKMIKSDSVRVRLRSRHHDGSFSDWSMASGNFAINVFKMVPPAIVNPVPYHVYTDFILIILDESLTINTFSQKVRYTLEYSSDIRNVDWTIIVKDIPVGQNVIRWDLEDVAAADDYVLRLTAKNASTSCEQTAEPTPDQISRRFVYNLKIQQPGMFLIDTKPPQAILDVESSSGITSELTQTLTVFAEDATSNVEQIQLRECDANRQLALGDVSEVEDLGTTSCTSVDDLLVGANFDTIIGKPQGYSTKTQWIFEDVSGLRRIEAMLTDSGGNNSLQALQNVFIPVFRAGTDTINDIIVVSESRDIHRIVEGEPQTDPTLDVPFEVAYIGTQSGSYWVLEPFPRLIAELGREIRLLIEYFDIVYILSYINNQSTADTGSIYREDKISLTNIFDFNQDAIRTPNTVAIFRDIVYIGLENGELWSFNGVTASLLNQFANPITTLVGDNLFLYIGQANSSAFVLYNGTEFFTSDLEP